MIRTVMVKIFGRDTPVDIDDDDGDDGSAGEREPLEPRPPDSTASVALDEP